MPKKWSEIRSQSKLAPEEIERISQEVAQEVAHMRLDDLRRARNLSQEQLAEALGVDQAVVSRIEHRADLYLSTLRRFVHAVGGTMRIIVEFPDSPAEIELEMLSDIEPPIPSKRGRPTRGAAAA